MSTVDRMADGYEPDFDIDYEAGQQGELFIANIIDSLKTERVETKADYRAATTGNVYLEVQCFRQGRWHLSGIATTKAEIWCHTISAQVCIAAPTVRVQQVARHYWKLGGRWVNECPRGDHPTRGVTLPIQFFVSLLANGIPGAT